MKLLDRFARAVVLQRLDGVPGLRLVGRTAAAGERRHPATQPAITLEVRDSRFYRALLFGGHLGAAEAYVNGWWATDDLVGLVQMFVRQADARSQLERGWARLAQPVRALRHALHRNTRRGSRRNIAAHYDLGNEFFREFLDETLTYSCGVFERPDSSLREASEAKYDRICRKLDLRPEDHVLEIGTGWGGFALHAALRYGCRVTTTTISRAQYEMARARIAAAGLADRVTVLSRDYRDLTGRYDKLVSIEMIEAVGHQYYRAFFAKCAELLKPAGAMALQAITILDSHYERARREVDFIKRYIFPGSCIPSVAALRAAWMRASDLRVVDLEDITVHYVTTLRRWRENFLARWDRIRAQGFGEEFRRLWELYFCYCEGGFAERYLGNVQIVLARSPR